MREARNFIINGDTSETTDTNRVYDFSFYSNKITYSSQTYIYSLSLRLCVISLVQSIKAIPINQKTATNFVVTRAYCNEFSPPRVFLLIYWFSEKSPKPVSTSCTRRKHFFQRRSMEVHSPLLIILIMFYAHYIS